MNLSHRSTIAVRANFLDFVSRYRSQLLACGALLLSDTPCPLHETTPFNKASDKLGQETDVVVFDLTKTLAVNALGAISGCIRGGGILLLILPEDSNPYVGSFFYSRLLKRLRHHEIPLCDLADANIPFDRKSASKTLPLATEDQQQAIAAIKKVVTGHRNRPLVITSHRGRGKTSALGMAIQALNEERSIKIMVCAPSKAMVAPLFKFAGNPADCHFIAPDKLVSELPEAGLVIIDEAGAIPVPILSQLLKHYSRVVFSTTLHGYEGNGRGFAIRFHSTLNQHAPAWRSVELIQPIRWGNNDPLESFIDDLLLLNAEPVELSEAPNNLKTDLVSKDVSAAELVDNEPLLRQIVGLLVAAHYQTRPSDLLHLLDDEQVSIQALLYKEQVVATAVISHEGGLDNALSEAIYRGERRPKGHLVPQILLAQVGLKEAALLKTDRIMRIATHALCRRRHLASRLLDTIDQASSADYLSTSFGLTTDLLAFWRKSNFAPVYLGLKPEASSGFHSAVMLKAQNKKGLGLEKIASDCFVRNFVAQLGDTLNEYNSELAYELLRSLEPRNCDLSPQAVRDIKRFANGHCGTDSAIAALQRWLPSALICSEKHINSNDARLLVMRILQHQKVSDCCEKLGLAGKQALQMKLQQTVSVLANTL